MIRKLLIATAALATTLATAIPAGAGPGATAAQIDDIAAPYVVVMEAQPVLGNDEIAPEGEEPPDPASAAVEEYEAVLDAEKVAVLEGAGIDRSALVASFVYAANGFSAALTQAEAKSLASQNGVLSVQRDELHLLHTSESPEFLGLDDPNGAWDSGYTGAGVVVGVIDSGIWPEHPSFAARSDLGEAPITLHALDLDPDPAMEILSSGCDFGDTAHNVDDADFACNNKLIGARDMRLLYKQFIGSETYATARDYIGHGTHTASTAIGNPDVEASIVAREFGAVTGIAPDAHVVAYSACGNLGCFGGDLAAAIDQAVADGVDVINYSIGSSTPGLSGPDAIAFLFAADADVFVATSAGNAGPGASSIGSPASAPWVTTVGASLQHKTYDAEAQTGGSEVMRYRGASITSGTDGQLPFVDAANLGNELCDPGVAFTGDLTGKVVLCLRGGPARVEKSSAVAEAGGAGMVLYNPDDVQDLLTDNHWVPSVHVNFTDGRALKQYIVDNGAAATVAITDGTEVRERGNTMAAFSSRGPVGLGASDDIIKPDVTAPGVHVLAGSSPTPALGTPGEMFQSISGTSMSSPHAAGLLALLKQAHPAWTPAMAKSALMTTARQNLRKEDGTTGADPFDFGSGHVDPSGRASAKGSLFNPGLVYDAGLVEYFGFLCDASPEIFVDAAATCGGLADGGIPIAATNLNYPSIAVSELPGAKTVLRTVTNVSGMTETYRAHIEEPPGFEVTVAPERITLDPGESAAFEVAFLNVAAPIGEWRYGSLSWVDDEDGRVRSPIAVKAAAIEFAEAVSGTGADGTVTIPAAFGYTGAYTANAHGMAADVPTAGSVTQDPNNSNWTPAEVGNGTTAHPFTVGATSHLRITLDAADLSGVDANATDIDIYLWTAGPDGTEVAASTEGGTNEIIDLANPAPGDYVLYIQGWAVAPPTATANYTFHRWDVPAAAGGGSLGINASPPSATLGATGEIVAGWLGLAPGNYLGVVSHSSDTLLGQTLVEVDNTP